MALSITKFCASYNFRLAPTKDDWFSELHINKTAIFVHLLCSLYIIYMVQKFSIGNYSRYVFLKNKEF